MGFVPSMVQIPLVLAGTGSGPGCTPVLCQAHKDIKFWFSNDSLISGWPVWLELLRVFFCQAYFASPVLAHKPKEEQNNNRVSFPPLHQLNSLKSSKTIAIPPQHLAPLGLLVRPSHPKHTKGREEVKAMAHGHDTLLPRQYPCADLPSDIPTMGTARDEPQMASGVLVKETSHMHISVGFCHLMSMVGCDIPVLFFSPPPYLKNEILSSLPTFPPSSRSYFTKTCLSGQRAGKRLILHCKKHWAEYFSLDIWDARYNIAVFLN